MAHCQNIVGALVGALGGDYGDNRPRHLTTAEKGKKVVTKKRKIVDRDTETIRAVAAAAEAAKVGGHKGALRIGFELSSAQRCSVLEFEQRWTGSPPGIATVAGRQVRLLEGESSTETRQPP
jgi:hypothetical protein